VDEWYPQVIHARASTGHEVQGDLINFTRAKHSVSENIFFWYQKISFAGCKRIMQYDNLNEIDPSYLCLVHVYFFPILFDFQSLCLCVRVVLPSRKSFCAELELKLSHIVWVIFEINKVVYNGWLRESMYNVIFF